jgi:hypothetical protein
MRNLARSTFLAACAAAVTAGPLPAQTGDLAKVPAAQLQSARAAARSAQAVVLGMHEDPDVWLRHYVANRPDRLQKLQAGDFNYTAAFDFLKEYVTGPFFRGVAVTNVIRELYGREPLAAEFKEWRTKVAAQQAWYITILQAERERMKADPFLRRQTVEAAYLNVFGRVPKPGDLSYWMPRSEGYAEMRAAGVLYLYHPTHAEELRATADRAYEVSYGMHSDAEVDRLLAAARPGRFTFAQMVHWLHSRHN